MLPLLRAPATENNRLTAFMAIHMQHHLNIIPLIELHQGNINKDTEHAGGEIQNQALNSLTVSLPFLPGTRAKGTMPLTCMSGP